LKFSAQSHTGNTLHSWLMYIMIGAISVYTYLLLSN